MGLPTSQFTIDIEDDVPVDIEPDDTFMANLAGATATEALDYFGHVGADELGTVKFLQSYDGALLLDSGGDPVTSEGKNVVLDLSTDGTVLTGYLEGEPQTSANMVIQITLNPDGDTQSNDVYTVELYKKIDDGSGTEFGDFSSSGGSNTYWIGIDGDIDPGDGHPYDIDYTPDPNENSKDMLITAIDPGDTINNDADDIGVDTDQKIDPAEGVRIDLVTALRTSDSLNSDGLDQSNPWNNVPAPYVYGEHYTTSSFSFKLIDVQGSADATATVRIKAYLADDDYDLTDDATINIDASDVYVASTGTVTIVEDGNDVVITGVQQGDEIQISNGTMFNRIEIINDDDVADPEHSPFAIGQFEVNTPIPGSHVPMDFDVEVTDQDGDTSSGQFTVTLDSPVLVVGKNVTDIDGQEETHAVPNPNLENSGEITGGSANDILIGDIGGSHVQGKDLNLVVVVDTSYSMTFSIPGSTSRMAALKTALNGVLDDLSESDADNVRVHIVEFNGSPWDSNPDSHTVGTYDIRTEGNADTTELNEAKSDVNNLSAANGTNYEAGLQKAIEWWNDSANQLNGTYVVNQTIFLSDGEPTFWYAADETNTSGFTTIGPGNFYHPDALEHITGTHTDYHTHDSPDLGDSTYEWSDPSSNWQDTVSEVDAINSFGVVEGVGIDLPSGSSGLDVLDVIEGAAYGSGVSDNVETAQQLYDTLQDISPVSLLSDVGGDRFQGGNGNDVIFGDAPFTDDLAVAAGLSLNPGSGYLVFRALEQGESNVSGYDEWDREDTVDYIINHAEELSQESATDEGEIRGEGNDTIDGGGGSDIIYAQEGNDTIIYDADDAVVDGGSGYDVVRLENGDDIDFSGLNTGNNPMSDIEEIDLLTDTNGNSLTNLSAQDVLDMTDSDNVLYINGDSGDSVTGSGWTDNTSGSTPAGYMEYVNAGVTLYVDNDITQSLV